MNFYKLKVATIIILSLFIFSVMPLVHSQNETISLDDISVSTRLENNIEITELGVVVINYRLTLDNFGTVDQTIKQDIIFHLPTEYYREIDAYNVISPFNHKLTISRDYNNTLIILQTDENFIIQSGEDVGIEVELVLKDIVIGVTEREGMYKVLLPIIPTSNLHIDRQDMDIVVPNSIPFYNISTTADRSQQMYFEIAEQGFDNITRIDNFSEDIFLLINEGTKSFTIGEVNSFLREIYISSKGEVMIRETIEITNAGGKGIELHKLGLNLIGPERDEFNVPIIRNITSTPSREPAIAARKTIVLQDTPINRLEIKQLTRNILGENMTAVISYEYKLDENLINTNLNSIVAEIPTSSTFKTIAKDYRIRIIQSDTYNILTDSSMEFELKGNDQLYGNNITLSYRPGFAWASNISFPVGTIIFLISLVGMMTQIEKRKEVSEDEIITKMRALTGHYSEKISLIRNILIGVKKWDKNNINIMQISNVKNEINSIRTRTAGELSVLRKDIIDLQPLQKELFNSITRNEQLLDRDIFQILQLYEQRRLNRINIQEMEKKLTNNENNVSKRMDEIISALQTNTENLDQK